MKKAEVMSDSRQPPPPAAGEDEPHTQKENTAPHTEVFKNNHVMLYTILVLFSLVVKRGTLCCVGQMVWGSIPVLVGQCGMGFGSCP